MWRPLFKSASGEEAIEKLLRDNILFSDVTARQIGFERNMVHLGRYRQTELIFRRGETAVGMQIVCKGSVACIVKLFATSMYQHLVGYQR
ncbi:MAG: hypothetical protein AMJ54_04180 [Deltaproteobacteria bacterium SG8_13]|nr:MAG: hypothetical protein AMJ54_04180 [Deltaproteobacteria bacterium SG8_13]